MTQRGEKNNSAAFKSFAVFYRRLKALRDMGQKTPIRGQGEGRKREPPLDPHCPQLHHAGTDNFTGLVKYALLAFMLFRF